MGVERRGNCLYQYEYRRESGRKRVRYLGRVMPSAAEQIEAWADLGAMGRNAARCERATAADGGKAVLAALAGCERPAEAEFRTIMLAAGHRLHKRSEWRRQRGAGPMSASLFAALMSASSGPRPPLISVPKSQYPEKQKLLDRAAAGDWGAVGEVRELLKDPHWQSWLGSVVKAAENALVGRAAGDDVAVWEGVRAMLADHRHKLTAEDGGWDAAPHATRRAATRASHCWLAVHTLEVLATRERPGTPGALERQLASAERRLHLALRSLATLRRLRRAVKPAKGKAAVAAAEGPETPDAPAVPAAAGPAGG